MTPSPTTALNTTLNLLQEATVDDARWPLVSSAVEQACRASGTHLTVTDAMPGSTPVFHFACLAAGGDDLRDAHDRYLATYLAVDERIARLRRGPQGTFIPNGQLYTEAERRTSAAYNEALRPAGYERGLSLRMPGPHGTTIHWTIGNPRGGAWNPESLAFLNELLPHLRRHLAARAAVRDGQNLADHSRFLLESAQVPVLQLGPGRRIVDANHVARRLLAAGDGLLERDGVVHARFPDDDRELERAADAALATATTPAVRSTVSINRLSRQARLTVHLLPMPQTPRDYGINAVSALAVVTDPTHKPRLNAQVAALGLGLTPTESRIACALVNESGIPALAWRAGRDQATVRWHVKNILRKLGLSTQQDLVRYLLSLPELRLPEPDSNPPGPDT